jgi:hypothetical protein
VVNTPWATPARFDRTCSREHKACREGFMRSHKLGLYLGITWILTVAIAYAVGWWSGVSSVTRVAAGTARTGFPLIVGVLLIVALVSGVAAFRARGYFLRGPQNRLS